VVIIDDACRLDSMELVSKTRNMSGASYPAEREDSDGEELSREQ
jgi:hypothetical protein